MSQYIVYRGEDGQAHLAHSDDYNAYLEHGVGDWLRGAERKFHKYYARVRYGNKWRYYYSKAELERALKKGVGTAVDVGDKLTSWNKSLNNAYHKSVESTRSAGRKLKRKRRRKKIRDALGISMRDAKKSRDNLFGTLERVMKSDEAKNYLK